MNIQENTKDLIQFIEKATSPFHVVETGATMLKEAGFLELSMTETWELKENQGYYTAPFNSSLFAFTTGSNETSSIDFRIAASHTDHPCLKIKPIAELTEGTYMKVNTDVYGGAILNTWVDRPLSIAGKVSLRSEDIFHPVIRHVDFRRPVLTIPNLAIHNNREMNKGVELNKQKDLLPIIGMLNDSFNKDNYFMQILSKELGVKIEDILDFDLYVYCSEVGQFVGIEEEFISGPRLDNLTSVYASLKAIINAKRSGGINVLAAFDNEEIGSKTKQGGDSTLLTMLLNKIYTAVCGGADGFYESVLRSMALSVDVSHAFHPNYPEKTDPVNKNYINQGFAIKIDLNQRYASDTEAIGIVQQLCEANDIKYQKFVKRSDLVGGSTLGTLISSQLPMKTVDIGIPMLAMHSARELMGCYDQYYLEKLLTAFYLCE